MSGTTKTHRVYELDYIRAISALFIVLFHYTTQYDNSIGHLGNWPVSVPWGAQAVYTFFLLTGYLTTCHYGKNIFQFAYKRWCRLWPTLAVCIVITSVVMALMMPERLRSIPDILLNFTMLPSYLGAKPVDGVYWTLSVEVIFYFWIAIILCIARKNRILLTFFLYLWAGASLPLNLLVKLEIIPTPVNLLQIATIAQYAPCFIIGIALYLHNSEKALSGLRLLPLYLLCVGGLWLGCGTSITIWTVAWALLIWLVTAGKLRFSLKETNFLHKCLVFLAGISYPLYLLHQFIGFAIIQKMEQLGAVNQLWIFVPITASVLLATAIHYLVELPTGKLLLKPLKK